MDLKGVLGKIAWVDLSKGNVKIEEPEEELYTKYLGGYGLGAYFTFTRQPAKADPLGTCWEVCLFDRKGYWDGKKRPICQPHLC